MRSKDAQKQLARTSLRGPKFGGQFQCKLVMTFFALISVKGIRNLERLFLNTKLCSYIVRLAQWKNKMVICDVVVFF